MSTETFESQRWRAGGARTGTSSTRGLDRKKGRRNGRVALGDGLDVAPAQPVVAVEDAPRRMDRALLSQIGVARARPGRRRRPRSIRLDQVFGRESPVRLVQTAKVVLADQRLPGRVALRRRFYRRGPGPRQVYMSSGGLDAARDDRLERVLGGRCFLGRAPVWKSNFHRTSSTPSTK